MKTIIFNLLLVSALLAQNIKLPKPQLSGGTGLYTSLNTRQTTRGFDKKELNLNQISQILWAASGVSRNNPKKRTAPSAWGNNEIVLYVFLKKGTYIYEPAAHKLIFISKADNRALTGTQDFVKDAPLTIVMIADLTRISQVKDESAKLAVSQIDTGYISQNIYLAVISEGLVTGARGSIDKEKLAKVLKLKNTQEIILANSVGYNK